METQQTLPLKIPQAKSQLVKSPLRATLNGMGKIRRGGYIIIWWKGDHEPRHVHVQTSNEKKLGRVILETMKSMEGWTPDRKLVEIIKELKKEGRL